MMDRKRCDRQLSDSNTRPVTVIGIQGSVRASEERTLLQFLLVSIVAIWLEGKVMASVVASVISDGIGGRLVCVDCDDEREEGFAAALSAARELEDFSHRKKSSLERGGGRWPAVFHDELLRGIQWAESARRYAPNELPDFDVFTVLIEPWRGLRAVAIGSNKIRRQRAAEVAIVIAITQFHAQSLAGKNTQALLDRVIVIPFQNQPDEEPLALTDMPCEHDSVAKRERTDSGLALTDATSDVQPQRKRRRTLTLD